MSLGTVGSTWLRPTLEDMSKPFDTELFLAGVLTGSPATRQRHLRQAMIIQAEIEERFQRETPWAWQRKHVAWFLEHRLNRRSEATQYYYVLMVRLLARRLQKSGYSAAKRGLISYFRFSVTDAICYRC